MLALMEHPADRLVRVCALLGKRVKFDFSASDGFMAKAEGPGHRWSFHKNPVADLRTCDICGKVGAAKRVCSRSDVYRWNVEDRNDYATATKDMLCMGCWNKVRAIVRKEDEADECRRLLNKLTRSISDERKNQDNRRTA
jgi:hypothetical protein